MLFKEITEQSVAVTEAIAFEGQRLGVGDLNPFLAMRRDRVHTSLKEIASSPLEESRHERH